MRVPNKLPPVRKELFEAAAAVWYDLPERYGRRKTGHYRFDKWGVVVFYV
jgi:hypothetical protein